MKPDEASRPQHSDPTAFAAYADGSAGPAQARLDVALKGSLPCVRCGYELQGLSVRGSCPECGTAIRATILYTVDPYAEALQPLSQPTVVAAGLILWSLGGLAAATAAWGPRLAELAAAIGFSPPLDAIRSSQWVVVAGVGVSALGALLSLVRPARVMPIQRSAQAALGIALYAPLAALLWRVQFVIDAPLHTPYIASGIDAERLLHRLAIGACLAGVLLSLRPNARALAARSLVLRTGRVHRQTIYTTLAAVGMTALGDLVRLAAWGLSRGPIQQTIDAIGVLLVVVGSLLITLAIAGIFVDSLRVARALRAPAPSLHRVLHGGG